MAKFESDNSDWCKGQLEDIEKRNAEKRKKDKSASAGRVKGNKLFAQKKYDRALKEYAEALEKTPYKPNILTNMALAHGKLKQWEDALEYCDRALHCDKGWTKALCRRAAVVVEQAKEEGNEGKLRLARVKALKDLEKAAREVRIEMMHKVTGADSQHTFTKRMLVATTANTTAKNHNQPHPRPNRPLFLPPGA